MKKQKRPDNEEPAHHLLYEALASLQSASEAQAFLQDLCTPAELQAMADRWQVVEPIKQDVPYRKIHEQTGVSVTTIGRVARSINYGSGGYNLIYERVKQNEPRQNQNRHPKKREAK
jgi:TrpR-related protein YerC/YecD